MSKGGRMEGREDDLRADTAGYTWTLLRTRPIERDCRREMVARRGKHNTTPRLTKPDQTRNDRNTPLGGTSTALAVGAAGLPQHVLERRGEARHERLHQLLLGGECPLLRHSAGTPPALAGCVRRILRAGKRKKKKRSPRGHKRCTLDGGGRRVKGHDIIRSCKLRRQKQPVPKLYTATHPSPSSEGGHPFPIST